VPLTEKTDEGSSVEMLDNNECNIYTLRGDTLSLDETNLLTEVNGESLQSDKPDMDYQADEKTGRSGLSMVSIAVAVLALGCLVGFVHRRFRRQPIRPS
jgi:hypothetical protein